MEIHRSLYPCKRSTEAPQPLIYLVWCFTEIGQIFFVILAKRADGRGIVAQFPKPASR